MSDATTTDRSGDARGDRGEAALATEAELRALCGRVRDQAKAGEYVEVAAARNEGTAVKVHGGQVESLTASVTASLGIRVVVDGRVGFAHAGSLADDVIADTLGQARERRLRRGPTRTWRSPGPTAWRWWPSRRCETTWCGNSRRGQNWPGRWSSSVAIELDPG
jgi:hypothetical protein